MLSLLISLYSFGVLKLVFSENGKQKKEITLESKLVHGCEHGHVRDPIGFLYVVSEFKYNKNDSPSIHFKYICSEKYITFDRSGESWSSFGFYNGVIMSTT